MNLATEPFAAHHTHFHLPGGGGGCLPDESCPPRQSLNPPSPSLGRERAVRGVQREYLEPVDMRSHHYQARGHVPRKPRKGRLSAPREGATLHPVSLRLQATYPGRAATIVRGICAVFRFERNSEAPLSMPKILARITMRRARPGAGPLALPCQLLWTDPRSGRRLKLFYATRRDAEKVRDRLLFRAGLL